MMIETPPDENAPPSDTATADTTSAETSAKENTSSVATAPETPLAERPAEENTGAENLVAENGDLPIFAARPARVAIVGRPNVGKSTLFNKLLGHRRSITLDTPGITRDAIVESVEWDGRILHLIDTGGLQGEAEIQLADQVHRHTLEAVNSADLLVVVFDAREGLNPMDRETVDIAGRSSTPVLYVANKVEGPAQEAGLVEFCELGIDMPLSVSAEHSMGLSEIRAAILEELDHLDEAAALRVDLTAERGASAQAGELTFDDSILGAEAEHPCRVALVGRPNVGKSSFMNLLAGEQLSLVDDTPGTTRDAIDTEIERDGRRYVFVDTAGMRRPSRVEKGVERISVGRSLEVIDRANVVVLLVEALEGITDQDARIAQKAWAEGRALVLLMNKTDLLPPATSRAHLESEIRRLYPTLSWAAIGFLCVTREEGVASAFKLIDRAHAAHNLRIPTTRVNSILGEVAEKRQPPVIGRGRLRMLYATQTAVRPPTIEIFVNRATVPTDYTRFIERNFREAVDLESTPLRIRYAQRDSHSTGRIRKPK